MNKKVMLIVDDVKVNRVILERMFCDDFSVLHAANGKEALALIDEYGSRISVVLLDLVMPTMDGFEVLHNMQKDGRLREIPVIVVTDKDSLNTELQVLELGVWDFVVKPYNVAVIHHRVNNVVRIKEAAEVRTENLLIRELVKKESAVREELRFRAEHDELTGLYNRRKFCEVTEAMLKANSDTEYFLIFYDIDNFNIVNNILGVSLGDKILKSMAKIIDKTIKGSGTYGRLDNDHFVTCYPKEYFDSDCYERNARVDCSSLGIDYTINLNFGIYQIKDRTIPVGQMCDRAGMAAHLAGSDYLKPYSFYDDTILDKILAEQEIVDEMEQALVSGQFQVYLQPVCSLFNKKTIGAEVLVRWLHPRKGLITPGQFIPIFEKNGFIIKLDNYVWEQAAQLLVAREKAGLPELPLSVNLSRRSIYSRNLVSELTGLIKKYGLESSQLRLEVTESAYTDDPEQIKTTMTALQEEGFMILMDDFGSGYSSLNMLKDMPVDMLKIDMKFLEDFDHSSRAGAIVTSVLRMARWLKIPVIAEGVETQEQIDFLYSIGCDQIQGYYFAKPLPVEEFELFIRESCLNTLKDRPAQISDDYATLLFGGDQIVTKLLSSVFGGVAFYEYCCGKLELIRANEGYYQIYGYTPQALATISDNVWQLMSEEEQKAEEAICLQAIRTGQAQTNIFLTQTLDGKPLWVECIYRCMSGTENRAMLCIAINNITDKLCTDKKLAEATAQLSVIMDNMDNGVVMYDIGQIFGLLSVNNSYYNILGYTEEQFEQEVKDPLDIIHPDDRQYMRDYISQAYITGNTPPHEYRALRRDGGIVWLNCKASLVQLEDTDKPTLFVVVADNTEQKKLQLKEQHEIERYKIITENSGTTVIEWDLITGEFFCTESFYNFKASQIDPEYIRTHIGSIDAVHPDDLPALLHFVQYTRSGQAHAEVSLRAKMTAGGYQWVHMTGAFLKDEKGKPLRIIGTIKIIDDMFKAKLETADRLDNIIMSLPFGIGVFKIGDIIEPLFFNDCACELFGFTREEFDECIRSNGIAFFNSEILKCNKDDLQTVVNAKPFERVLPAQKKYGTKIWLRFFCSIKKDRDGKLICYATLSDVTAQHNSEL